MTEFPLYLYVYEPNGTYGKPSEIANAQELETLMNTTINVAVHLGREVVITDPLDFCVFHAKDGAVIFPVRYR